MKPRFAHEPIPPTKPLPVVGLAPVSPHGYRIRLDGREVGPPISMQHMAEYLQTWLEFAMEDLHRE